MCCSAASLLNLTRLSYSSPMRLEMSCMAPLSMVCIDANLLRSDKSLYWSSSTRYWSISCCISANAGLPAAGNTAP
ncbi:hypothetical protein D3C76_1307410 [compost metagenome]